MKTILCALLLLLAPITRAEQALPQNVLLPIVQAEDRRDWNPRLIALLGDRRPLVRCRALLAAGRIGDIRALSGVTRSLGRDPDTQCRAEAAFALGLIASPQSAPVLVHVLHNSSSSDTVRARSVEALGKIAAALPDTRKAQKVALRSEIYGVLNAERSHAHRLTVLLGLTAALRAGPSPDAGHKVGNFLLSSDARIRADAANVLARLHVQANTLLLSLRSLARGDAAPDVRANAARALAAAHDTASADILTRRAAIDPDVRVRVSAVRALGLLQAQASVSILLARAHFLREHYAVDRAHGIAHPAAVNELLEIVTALGQLQPETQDASVLAFLRFLRYAEHREAPETEIAAARITPDTFVKEDLDGSGWRVASARAQGLGELAGNKAYDRVALSALRGLMRNAPVQALPDVLHAFAGFHAPDTRAILQAHLTDGDVFVRATAAELLGDLPPDAHTAHVLASTLPRALCEQPNDDARYLLGALAAQHTTFADIMIETALSAPDRVVRARAADLLRANGVSDFSRRVGMSTVRLTYADYRRAVARSFATAVVDTEKGTFVIKLLPQDAPLTVDSFIRLARRGFFNGLTFHRVVPDFVVQGGDPRGDGSGGPGYSLRDEFNTVPYGRGTVGMALDGPDTGGSQWFVTHAPQPHLDGHYTVFGQVIKGMDVVDRLARGDRIRTIRITEGKSVGYTAP